MGERGLGLGGGSGLRRILGGVFLVGGGLKRTWEVKTDGALRIRAALRALGYSKDQAGRV
jgi:hypothetical protein